MGIIVYCYGSLWRMITVPRCDANFLRCVPIRAATWSGRSVPPVLVAVIIFVVVFVAVVVAVVVVALVDVVLLLQQLFVLLLCWAWCAFVTKADYRSGVAISKIFPG